MTKLHIASNLSLPLDTVTQSLAILARKRAGKSYLARGVTEQLLKAEQQVVIIDPKGDWWGIRSSADGKNPGFPVVVLGGEHGDLPLEKTAAETVARLIVEEQVSVLLDLSDFRKKEIAEFLGGDIKQRFDGLLEIIYRLKAKEEFRTPLMLIVDEADAIAPQKPYPGEERMLGAMSDIVRRGGQRGIGSLLITQRSSVINKDVLTQTQVMIAMRTIAELDMDAIMGWVKVHGRPDQARTLEASLPSLPTGDAWILSPGWPTEAGIFERIHAAPITTFDSGATPEPGKKRIKPRSVADIDLGALQRRMAETIERVKADDPVELKKKIARLEKMTRAGVTVEVPAAASGAKAKDSFSRGYEAGLRDARKSLHEKQAALRKEMTGLARETKAHHDKLAAELLRVAEHNGFAAQAHKKLGELGTRSAEAWASWLDIQPVGGIDADGGRLEISPLDRVQARVNARALQRPPTGIARGDAMAEPANGDRRIVAAEQRILDAIAEFEALQIPRPARVQVAFMAGYTNLNSKGFTNAIGALRTGGQIDYPTPGALSLTSAGRAAASPVEEPMSSRELQQRLMDMLGGANARILKVLIEAYPGAIDREAVAANSGYGNLNSKGFTNAIGRLRTLGLIDYPERGKIKAQPVLFLEANYETA